MFRLPILWVFFLVSCVCTAQETLIKPGDTLTVVTAGQIQYSGDFLVGSDGAITLNVVGRIQVGGRPLTAIQREAQRRVREYVRDATVTVILKTELTRYVYLVSERVTNGAVVWAPGMDVRQLVAKHPNLGALDSYEAKLYHAGKPDPLSVDLTKLLRDGDDRQNYKLDAGDVLALNAASIKSVWVVGAVDKPGEVHIRPNEGVSQAIAQAGGPMPTTYSSPEITVRMRRGDQSFTKTMAEVLEGQSWDLLPGDTISVELPKFLSVTIGGSVKKPGEIKIREGTTIVPAIEAAGGPQDTGTLQNLILFRGDETRVFDGRSLSQGGTDPGFALQAGDFVYVPENRREYHVLGFVVRPGRKLMPDSKPTRLADAVAAAEGINLQRGTYRHMIVMRPDSTGKYIVQKFDLDRYLKDGDAKQNPEIQPGDIVFVDQISGTALGDIVRLIPSLILLDRFF